MRDIIPLLALYLMAALGFVKESFSCTVLQQNFSDFVYLPGSAGYNEYNGGDYQWSNTTIEQPGCVVVPTNSGQLASAFAAIVRAKLPFAIRSGGHMPNPGFANLNGGASISLSKLTSISYDTTTNVAKLGSGARWYQVYNYLEPYGVAVAGGTNGGPGVGGLVLGGGISYFYNKYGFSSDTVVNFEVVLANGSIVNASKNSNSDLFWALQGGSANFGIVTRIDMTAFPVSTVWSGTLVFTGDTYNDAVDAMEDYLENRAGDEKASVNFAAPANDTLGAVLFYDDPSDTIPAAFERFTALPAAAGSLSQTTVAALGTASMSISTTLNGYRRFFNTLTVKNSGSILNDLFVQYLDAAAELTDVTGFAPQIAALPMPQTFIEKTDEYAGPAALDAPDGTYICILHLSTWSDAADDAKVFAWSEKTTTALEAAASARGLLHPFIFMNDAGFQQDPFAGYQASNVAKLKTIAKKYDPSGAFQTLQNDGFKLLA